VHERRGRRKTRDRSNASSPVLRNSFSPPRELLPLLRPLLHGRYILREDLGSVASLCGLSIEFWVVSKMRSGVSSVFCTSSSKTESANPTMASTPAHFFLDPIPPQCLYLHWTWHRSFNTISSQTIPLRLAQNAAEGEIRDRGFSPTPLDHNPFNWSAFVTR